MTSIARLDVVVAVLARPSLWPTAFRQACRTVPTRWWCRRPFLPVPTGEYVRFRMVTQYGDPSRRPETGDVLNYLAWCRAWDQHDPVVVRDRRRRRPIDAPGGHRRRVARRRTSRPVGLG